MASTRDDTAVSWPAVSAAVALLTAQRARSCDSRAGIIGPVPAGEVITALEVIAGALLHVLSPDDDGAQALEALGLLAAGKDAGRP